MIDSITLGNFKCFENEEIPLRKLTLLSGINGAGKSSVIQSLLILRQIFLRADFRGAEVSLSGDLVDLGGAIDILFSSAQEDVIFLKVRGQGRNLEVGWLVDLETGEASWGNRDEVEEEIATLADLGFALFNGGPVGTHKVGAFNYLNAERFGPRKALPMGAGGAALFDVGKHGEKVFDALLAHQDRIVLGNADPRRLKRADGDRLRDQIEAWLDEISPGVRLDILGFRNADLAIGSFSFGREGALRSPDYRPTNVGFGLSYILPVLAALLAAPPGGLVLIENPEAHLHPRGQTRMGELCAAAAAAGVQVILETHSDHVLDGARLAVRNGLLASDDAIFHFLHQKDGITVRRTPTIDREGRLSEWPDGFFDQHRRNAALLAKPVGRN
ncbi:DUF3696 domain-containing protein [Caulobacter sp. 3R27C2-B]|uniref:DUF3696 domain-containing protein n=1 Tax=Caulobacter sp. 3R27C2-B TaxID=2502219 RepID=UPI0010F5F0F3|nr:DUF3696 domain-containing protein [Caulobacter sp. 3R27C2-B]